VNRPIQTYYSYQSLDRGKKVSKKRHRRIFTLACIVVMFIVIGASNVVQNVTAATKERVAAALPVVPAETKKLQSVWQTALTNQPGQVAIAVYDNKTGNTASYATNTGTFNTASVVKVSIIEAALARDQANGTGLTANEAALATPMIENSDNDSATALWESVGGQTAMDHFYILLGMKNTTAAPQDEWGLTQTTATDQLAVVNTYAYSNKTLTDTSRKTITDLLDNIESDQAWGVSAGLPNDVTVELKNGWLEDDETNDAYANTDDWIVNSIGHIYGEGQDYTIAILSQGDPSQGYGIDAVQQLATLTWQTISQ
jgi:beta-lactamase class A